MAASDQPTPSGSFSCTLQVRWGDFDQLGHVNNVRYLEYAQEARLLFFRARHGKHLLQVQPMVVRHSEIDFLRPVLPSSATVEVEVEVLRIGTTSFTMRHTIRDAEGAVCAVVDAVLVAFDEENATATAINEPVRAMLDAVHRPALGGPEAGGSAR